MPTGSGVRQPGVGRAGACQYPPKAIAAIVEARAKCRYIARPTRKAPVAQLDRAPDYESGGQEFESLRARHLRTKPRRFAPWVCRPAMTAARVVLCPMILTLSSSTSI